MNRYHSLDEIENTLKDILPSGSDINGTWEFDDSKKFYYAKNHFEILHYNGFYVTSVYFTLRIDKNDLNNFTLTFNKDNSYKAKYWAKRENIREYLEEHISQHIRFELRMKEQGK